MRSAGQQTTSSDTGAGHATPLIPTAQSKLPNSLPAVVITSDYYAQPKVLVVHALNNSGKDIVGYTFITRYKKPDGTIDKGIRGVDTTDMLSVLVTAHMSIDPCASESVLLQ